ncbi:RNA 2',3'-cyclic phosphodiesterase [Nibribacter ruber]|uniref:RNA 2',3'-cyclic phosphodiesterase n=1 Tax=Nibribacter ruber TaxID=2698458 RepID=A0A6P1NRP9_9BACT|nr:RNA 2',3'-cyclic phosphodiesterase [Nibribacter ruber]QHL86496.1 RNA 2',3'-cyclic phosphodiesterase [Nibribacter ruber]
MQEHLRLFVAVPLPNNLLDYLLSAREAFDSNAIRMVPAQNLHLTLFFIGNVPAIKEIPIINHLKEIAQQYQPFTLTLEQLEPGPKRSAPRLIWARFQALAAFEKLSLDLANVFSPNPSKHDKFIPHVTVCRFKKEIRPAHNMPLVQPSEKLMFPVKSLALWQSVLGSPHPVYTVVQEFPLGKQPRQGDLT